MTRLLAAYFLATAAGWMVSGAITVFVLNDMDPKFRDAPLAAFEIELIAGAVFTLLSTLLIGVVAALLRNRLSLNRRSVAIAIAWGLAYPMIWQFGARLLGQFDDDPLFVSVSTWVYLLCFPLLIFVPLARFSRRDAAAAFHDE